MRIQHISLLLLATIILAACSGDKNDTRETATEKSPREVAQKTINYIQAPIDKARTAAALAEEHTREIQQNIQDTTQ